VIKNRIGVVKIMKTNPEQIRSALFFWFRHRDRDHDDDDREWGNRASRVLFESLVFFFGENP
jgi:hypothetical protein